jgi:hypothetical protein
MTWVVGIANFLGYGAAISDIQVSWPQSGRVLDCLQKVYGLGPNLAGGFAGSVEVGFRLLGDIAAILQATALPGHAILPRAFAHRWYRRARRVFSEQPTSIQQLGSELLLVSVSPVERVGDSPWPRADVIVMRSRSGFSPEFATGLRCLSIGSGSGVEVYREALADPQTFFNLEIGGGTGIALGLAMRLRHVISKHPQPGISRYTHLTLVRADSVTVQPMNFTDIERDGTVVCDHMPPVARSWEEFSSLAQQNGLASAEAMA